MYVSYNKTPLKTACSAACATYSVLFVIAISYAGSLGVGYIFFLLEGCTRQMTFTVMQILEI